MSDVLRVWRCSKCDRIVAKIFPAPGMIIEVKCASCNTFNTMAVPMLTTERMYA